MKIAFVNLTGGGLSGGGRKTMTRLLPQLQQAPEVEIKLFLHPLMKDFSSGCNLDCYLWPKNDYLMGYPGLKNAVRQYNPDVVFIPNSILPDFGDIPTVIMVRNMEALAQPIGGNKLPQAVKNLIRRYIYKRSCRKATRVIAISRFVKEYLMDKWHIAEDKINVIYHGVDKAEPRLIKPQKLQSMSTDKFIFSAGSFLSYRGYEDAIKAFAECKLKNTSLVLAGDSVGGSKYMNRMRSLVEQLGMSSQIILPGNLDKSEMSWCYANCSAFVMTSRIEACPNVVLEALSFGCVNISTLSPPMPEMFGTAALYYQAGDIKRLKELLVSCNNLDTATREKYSAAARELAAGFSWEKNVEKLLGVFGEMTRLPQYEDQTKNLD